jgi:hypothetical protein
MKTVTISGWEIGFQKVGFTELLKREFGYSLSAAKAATDSVLENHRLDLNVPEEEYDSLVPRLLDLGAKVAIEAGRDAQNQAPAQLELSKS